jgi:hypothetical protein
MQLLRASVAFSRVWTTIFSQVFGVNGSAIPDDMQNHFEKWREKIALESQTPIFYSECLLVYLAYFSPFCAQKSNFVECKGNIQYPTCSECHC